MRFLFLLYGDPAGEAALSPARLRDVVDGHVALGRELGAAGRLHAAAALGAEVRVLRADGIVTDGPFAEAKEQLGGLYVLDVPGIDEAVAWAAKIPMLPTDAVEVRPSK